jgi:hypothetical protein
MVVLLLLITPLYCTFLAPGFYFRVVVIIRAHLVLPVVIVFWLKLDHLIKPCFLPALPLPSLLLIPLHTHYKSISPLNFCTPTPLLTSRITSMLSHVQVHYGCTLSCAPLTMHFSLHASCLSTYPCTPSCLLDFSLISGSVSGSSPL